MFFDVLQRVLSNSEALTGMDRPGLKTRLIFRMIGIYSRKRLIMLGAGAAAMSYLWLKKKAEQFVEKDAAPAASDTTSERIDASASDVPMPPPPPGEIEPLSQHLFEFLAGNSWLDARQWRDLWSNDSDMDIQEWLLDEGAAILNDVRRSLVTQPALLSGCRRRWLVVCRHAGIDESLALDAWRT